MTFRRGLSLGAIASCSLLAAGAGARADYAYSTVTSPASKPLGSGGDTSTIALGPVSASGLSGSQNIALVDVTDAVAGTGATGSVSFTSTVTITDPSGSGTLTWGGTINFSRSDPGGETSAFTLTTPPGSLTIDGTTYTISDLVYAQPTVNAPPGSTTAGRISGFVTVTSAPAAANASAIARPMPRVPPVTSARRPASALGDTNGSVGATGATRGVRALTKVETQQCEGVGVKFRSPARAQPKIMR